MLYSATTPASTPTSGESPPFAAHSATSCMPLQCQSRSSFSFWFFYFLLLPAVLLTVIISPTPVSQPRATQRNISFQHICIHYRRSNQSCISDCAAAPTPSWPVYGCPLGGFSSPGFDKEINGELRGWPPAQGAWVDWIGPSFGLRHVWYMYI